LEGVAAIRAASFLLGLFSFHGSENILLAFPFQKVVHQFSFDILEPRTGVVDFGPFQPAIVDHSTPNAAKQLLCGPTLDVKDGVVLLHPHRSNHLGFDLHLYPFNLVQFL